MNLSKFKNANLFEAGTDFFKQLGVNLQTNTSQSILAQNILKEHYKDIEIFNSIKETYYLGLIDDSIFSNSSSLFANEGLGLDETLKKVDEHYDGIMVFAINLYDYYPSRTDIALLVRAFNKSSKKVPVILLLNYKHYGNSLLTFAASERNKYQQTWRYGEKLGKISMLRDIDIEHTHTGHLKILQDLKLRSEVGDFEALHKQWIEVFDVQLLNKRFYQDISNWYFWALQYVDFPEDAGTDKDLRNATSLIRLLTRIIFVWFLKEKHLVPEELFDKNQLENILDYKDKNSSTFYKAVLQNLFFATLNTPMKKDNPKSRIFIDEAKRNGFVNDGYLQSGYFRYRRFIKNPELFLDKFSSIPFLNGGLFECLDDKIDGKEIRIDCFSDNPKNENKLKVPDVLFFSDELQVDLNNIYDTRNRSYSTKGLIKILNSYKFTITENTPIEEEIALDPELLGKVFENLLASYNPETGTTARKATGSFYTPREIVNYMVDESIIAYLEQKLVEQTPSSVESNLISVQEKLRQLVSYTEQLHQFEPNEVETLINAIENLKILDPACGSGAFPMGVLHKLVLILHKLDPDNKIWLQKLIDRTPPEIREETRKALANKPLDYIRKLGLIENCIYGVDIQPIAIQIAKLRFFISLIVEQKIDDTKENQDIKPLPNLETKFVAANTLIGLEKDNGFKTPEVENAENELFRIRKDIFYTNSSQKKKKLQEKEKTARQALKNALLEGSFNNKTAEQIASWDPFDQNTSASWFDPEWMFGVKDGFDIVISNPPYVNVEKIDKSIKDNIKLFKTAYQKFDLYVLFYEKGLNLLKENGILSYITSNKFLSQGYGLLLRQEFLKYKIQLIVNFNYDIFESATVRTCILQIQKHFLPENIIKIIDINSVKDKDKFLNQNYDSIKQEVFSSIENFNFRMNLTTKKLSIINRILSNTILLENICSVNYGLRPSSEKLNLKKEAFIYKNNPFNLYKPYFEGKDMGYWLVKNVSYIDYKPDVMYNAMFSDLFENEKLIGLRTLSDIGKLRFIYDNKGLFCNDSVVVLTLWYKFANVDYPTIKRTISKEKVNLSRQYSYQYLQGILNSKIIKFYVNELMYDGTHFYPNHMKALPIKKAPKEQQKPIEEIVSEILKIVQIDKEANISEYEARLNIEVFKLYELDTNEISIIEESLK